MPSEESSEWPASYENDTAVIYGLDRELKITRCNRAWDKFALENHGSQITRDRMSGFPVMNVIPAALRGFYEFTFNSVLKDGAEWLHVYECSSSSVFRRFQMRVLPHAAGLLIVNSLVSSLPHNREEHSPDQRYFGNRGMATMCCHCRRTQRTDDRSRWDWVPALVDEPPAALSHGLCKLCMAYHYPWIPERN